jgi:hypothetical protein
VTDPPAQVCYDLDEAVTLLWDLENAAEALEGFDALSPLAGIDQQIVVLNRKLFAQGG